MNTSYKHIDGLTSTFIHGEQGDKGRRARVTFISSYNEGRIGDNRFIEQYKLTGDDFYSGPRSIDFALNDMTYQFHGITDYPKYPIDGTYNINNDDVSTYTPENQEEYQRNVTNPPIGSHLADSSIIQDASTYITDVLNNYDFTISSDGTKSSNISPEQFFDASNSTNLPLGNIIERSAISSIPLTPDQFEGYKFYEEDQVNIDSSVGYIATIPNSYISIIVPEFDVIPKVVKRLPEYPEPYDYIIYIDKNITYLLLIQEVSESKHYEPIECKCKILDTWRKSNDIATSINDTSDITDNIKLYSVNYPINHIVLDYNTINSDIINGKDDVKPATKYRRDDTTLKNFLLTSTKGKIGNYKIVAEFFYKPICTLPVHSIIADRFLFNDSTMTYIGNSSLFYRTSDKPTNFDNERLDTFEVIIKDFEDGVDNLTYSSTVKFYIPIERYNDYTVNIFIYYKKLNGSYNKFLVNSLPYKQFIEWDDLINNIY